MPNEQFLNLLASSRTLVMGVLNVTPDSFSDGGQYLDTSAAIKRASMMISEGADIVDIGGQSTRPAGSNYGTGAELISTEEELARVTPVITGIINEHPEAIISIDTFRAEVAEKALSFGASIINDVSGATADTEMLEVARKYDAPIVLMHGYGPQFERTSIDEYHYDDVVNNIFTWLRKRIELAREAGVSVVLADIGFGFAKSAEDNISVLKHHRRFEKLGVPMVLGISRKATIGKILGDVPPSERLSGSLAGAVWGALNGAKIIRTHDVKETVDAMKVTDKLLFKN